MKKLYLFLLLSVFFIIFNGCSNQDDNPVAIPPNDIGILAKNIENQETYLRILARQLAVSLNDPGIVNLLENKFETTNSRENILNFSELLSEEITHVTFARKITSASLKANQNLEKIITEGEIDGLIKCFDHGLDLYFPIVEHKTSWKSNINQIVVAYPPLSVDDNVCDKIVAFTLSGDEKELSAKTPPPEPVLLISPCEHNGDHSRSNGLPLNKSLAKATGEYRMTIYHFRLMNDHEPWYSGDAEIYVKLLYYGWNRTNCVDINEEKTYWDYNKFLNPAWFSMPTELYRFEVWEDDGSSGDDLVEQYWHYPYQDSDKSRYVDTATVWPRWYYGDANDADLYMSMKAY